MATLFFKVLSDTPMAEHIERLKGIETKRGAALDALRAEFKIPSDFVWLMTDAELLGVRSKGPLKPDPAAWKFVKKYNYYVPLDKALKKAMKAIPPGLDHSRESDAIFNTGMVMKGDEGGFRIYYASFAWSEKGSLVYMHSAVRKAAKIWPEGLVEITATEAETIVEFADT